METKSLLLEHHAHGVSWLRINRPDSLNALNSELLNELGCVLSRLAAETAIRVLLITGVGKAFVAGADICEMEGMSAIEGEAFGRLGAQVFRQIELLPFPVIAAVNGFALGGGCELALACDIRIASERAVFGQPEVGLGITAGFGGTQRLPRLVGRGIASELLFTGRSIKAEEALRIGLVNRVVGVDDLEASCEELAREIATKGPIAVRYTKRAIQRGMQADIDTANSMENSLFGLCFSSKDQREGMGAFLQKRKPDFLGE